MVASPAQVTDPPAVTDDAGHPRRWAILAVLASVAFMAQLDLFIVNVGLPSIGRSFHGSSLSGLSWVLDAYAIVFAALLVPAGRLADHLGRRRFLLVGVAIFTASSAACALAPDLGVLVAARGLQAVGAALIVPTSLGLLYPAFPRHQHTLVVGIWAGVAAVAASSGPPVGGLLVALSWRWIFLINLPIGIVTIVAGLRILPEVRAPRGSRLPDAASGLTLFAAVTLGVLATVQGPEWGWDDPRTVALFFAAAVLTAVTVHRSLTVDNAVVERALFAGAEFTAATVALFLFFVGFAIFLLITVLFLQQQWGYSALRSGLGIAPGPMTAAVFAVSMGRISGRFGRTAPALVGALCMAGSATFWLISATATPSYLLHFLPGLILGGAAAGLSQAPLFAAASTLAADRATTGSAVLNMSRQVGSAVGVALLVALLAGGHDLADFHRGWCAEIAAGLLTALVLSVRRLRTRSS